MIKTLPGNELSVTKPVVVGWICNLLDVWSGYRQVIKTECDNVLSQDANIMEYHTRYNILAGSSWVCSQSNS